MIHTLAASVLTRMPYWTGMARNEFAAVTEQAKPAARTANTSRIEHPVEKLRLCRVVRGLPRKAKVTATNTKA